MKPCFIAVLIMLASMNVYAENKKLTVDIENTFSSGSKATFSTGWSYDDKLNLLSAPENDLKVYFIETDVEKDIEKQTLSLWKKIDPTFNYPTHQKVNPPKRDGWDEIHQINYDVPSKESRVIISLVRIFKGKAYINLVDGTYAAMERRGSQFQIAVETWKPKDLKKETLGDRTAKVFGPKEQKEFLAFATEAAKKLQVPGVSMAVVQGDKIVFEKAIGVKQMGKKGAVEINTPFMIGSTTKPLTTLMLAKLVDLKKLSWDTPITSILPEFKLADKDTTKKLQVKHTACACTGMPRRDMEFVFETENMTGEKIVAQMSDFKPTTAFGETFQYSNHLVALGGYVGGAAYLKSDSLLSSYEKAMSDLVFGPLGMTHTFVKPTDEVSKTLPSPHSLDQNGKMVAIPQKMDDMVYSVAPAGSIWSTAHDLARYVMMELNNGKDESGKQIFSAEQIEARRTPGVKVDESISYGLGLLINRDKELVDIGHGGNTLGFTSNMMFYPKDKLGLVVLTNAGSANRFRALMGQKFLEIVYGAEVKSTEQLAYGLLRIKESFKKAKERLSQKSKETKWIEQFIGKYQNPGLGIVEIKKVPQGLSFDVGEWSSLIASAKDLNGDKFISLISSPWSGSFEFIPVERPKKKLILDLGQIKYEFEEVVKEL